MTSNINLKDIEAIRDKLKKIEELKETSDKLIEVAEYVLDKECPFEFNLDISIIKDVPVDDKPISFDMQTDSFDSPQAFLDNLYKMNDRIDKKEKTKKKRVYLSLNSISNKTFLAIVEKLVVDVKQSINNNLNNINVNE